MTREDELGPVNGGTVDVLGIKVDRLSRAQSLDACERFIRSGTPHHHCGVNASKLVDALQDAPFADSMRRADLVNADGMSVVWASRLLGDPLPERVAGIDLMDDLLALCADKAWPVYLLGARATVVEAAAAASVRRHPGLVVAGYRDGYFDPADEESIARSVAGSGAHVLFVGMTSPLKEHFYDRNRHLLNGVGLVMGVGGSFDVIGGAVERAPKFIQDVGMEWAFRLWQEPRRLLRRYMVGNSTFLVEVARQRLQRKD